MKFSTAVTVALVSAIGVSAADEKVIGTFIFGRHGDRTAKPNGELTPVGIQQVFEAGNFYHSRYFNDSSDANIEGLNETYQSKQVTAASPGGNVLQKSQQGFLQGFYPPLDKLDVSDDTVTGSSLSNGSTMGTPLDNYQYVVTSTFEEETPNAIKITGVDGCKNFEKASDAYLESDEFKKLNKSTFDFYQGLYPLVEGILNKSELNFGEAYTVFDKMLVNNVHNETFSEKLKDHQDDFDQVRFLQDQYTKGLNYNSSNTDTILGGKSLVGAIYSALNETKTTGKPLVTYYAGSYNVFYQVFAVLGLFDVDEATFTGLVNYASTFAFELVEKDSKQYVRFGLRNGTESTNQGIGKDPESPEFKTYPIFGEKDKLIPYSTWESKVKDKAINDLNDWCSACGSWDLQMCIPYSKDYLKAKEHDFNIKTSSLSLAGAGGIGAGVTIGVFALIGALAFFLCARKRKTDQSVPPMTEAKASNSYTTSVRSNNSV